MQHLQPDTILQNGKYKIERVLGQGGFGITYLASQTFSIDGPIGSIKTEIKLAVKEFFMSEVCNRDKGSSHVSVPSVGSLQIVEQFKRKFLKEARNISGLNHPNIIKVVDVFEENGTAYYVMEYHGNGSLRTLLNSCHTLPETDALRYIRQIADALRAVLAAWLHGCLYGCAYFRRYVGWQSWKAVFIHFVGVRWVLAYEHSIERGAEGIDVCSR